MCHQTLDVFGCRPALLMYFMYHQIVWMVSFIQERDKSFTYIGGVLVLYLTSREKKTPVEAFTKVGHSVDHSSSESRLALALRQSICVLVQSVWAGRCWELLQGLNKTWKAYRLKLCSPRQQGNIRPCFWKPMNLQTFAVTRCTGLAYNPSSEPKSGWRSKLPIRRTCHFHTFANMLRYIYIYIYICIYIYIRCIYVFYTYIYIYTYYTHTHTHIYIYICVCVCVNPSYTGRGMNMQGDSLHHRSDNPTKRLLWWYWNLWGLSLTYLQMTCWFQIFITLLSPGVTNRGSPPQLFGFHLDLNRLYLPWASIMSIYIFSDFRDVSTSPFWIQPLNI